MNTQTLIQFRFGLRFSRAVCLFLWSALVILPSFRANAQTRLKLSAIKPGTEQVQLMPNGDFQFPGAILQGERPNPVGWSRGGEMFAGLGTNTAGVNLDSVAQAFVSGGFGVSGYNQLVTLEPNTAYVLSAYLWNLGNATHRVNTVVDLSDAPGEPQMLLTPADADADQGYFVYRSFNTSTTGTNVTVRIFYDGLAGTGAAAEYYPVAAQWDNIAITKASAFVAPQASNAVATMRPLVRLISPTNGVIFTLNDQNATLTLTVETQDLDGSITNVQFRANGTVVGERPGSPWSVTWNDVDSGNYVLTATAFDNTGASTLSAPVSISVARTRSPKPPVLSIALANTNVVLSWSTTNLALVVETATNLLPPVAWQTVTNPYVVLDQSNVMTLAAHGAQKFFRLAPEVDASTMHHKLLMGYQGWFAAPNDGSPPNRWVHWFRNNNPAATNATFDMWPDTSEFDEDELFATGMKYADGTAAKLFSAYKEKTVMRHFRWMWENHLDGVFLQRFTGELGDPAFFALRNKVTQNVRAGAEAYGRVFAIMYDISGQPTNTLVSRLTNDWAYLVNTLQITNSPFHLRHKGRPVVAIWGFGFSGRPDTPQQAQQAIDFFKAAGCTVVGGLPTNWRTLNSDAQTNAAWAAVFRSFDIISPWTVGRYRLNSEVDSFRVNYIVPDLAAATNAGREYMPVIFPGFSWTNLNAGPYNQMPRNGGNFYWRQAYNVVRSGCTMIYGAMFDEVDEGTAMFKIAPTPAEQPINSTFVPLNVDGTALPSDWYLKLADQAGRMLRGEILRTLTLPISP